MSKECNSCGYRDGPDELPFRELKIENIKDTRLLFACPYCDAVFWEEDIIYER